MSVESIPEKAETFWTLDAPPLPELPTLDQDLAVDVAIIGGGFTGLACAVYLKRFNPETSVAVLEAQRLGSGASSRNAGSISAEYDGWSQARGRQDTAGARTPSELARRYFDRLKEFLREEGIECDLRAGRALVLATKRHAKALRRHLSRLKEAGLGGAWIDEAQLRAELGTTTYAGGLADENWYFLHPGKLVTGLAESAQRAGVALYEHSRVTSLERGHPVTLRTTGGTVTAGQVVIATNAYAPTLVPVAAKMMPIHHAVLVSRPLTDEEMARAGLELWPLRYETGRPPYAYWHTLTVTPDRRLLVRDTLGYRWNNSLQWPHEERQYERVWQKTIQRYAWAQDLTIEYRWHGLTGHTRNGQVIFGSLRPRDGIHLSVAYNGHGLLQAHYNGYLMAMRVLGEPQEEEQLRYGPGKHGRIPREPFRSLIVRSAIWLGRRQ